MKAVISRRNDSGAALLLAVLVLAILIALVGQMTITASHNRAVSSAALADLQNAEANRAGYYHAVLYLQADLERGDQKDHLNEMWANPIQKTIPDASTVIWIRIQDVDRKLNLSRLVKDDGQRVEEQVERLRRMLEELGHDPEHADRITDYMDKDSKGNFESGVRNERPFNLEELLRVPGIEREVLYGDEENELKGIMEFVTLWPAKGDDLQKINFNTAPPEVMVSLHDDLTMTVAEAIVSHRNSQDDDGSTGEFGSPGDVQSVPEVTSDLYSDIAPSVSVKSNVFEVHVRSVTGTVEKAHLYVVERKQGKTELLFSIMEQDSFWVKPPEDE
jgi:type II secretory pathway component PulK